MTDEELDALEETIPELAVKALNAAQQRAEASGHDIVVVVGNELVRIGPGGTTVLKTLPEQPRMTEMTKRATS